MSNSHYIAPHDKSDYCDVIFTHHCYLDYTLLKGKNVQNNDKLFQRKTAFSCRIRQERPSKQNSRQPRKFPQTEKHLIRNGLFPKLLGGMLPHNALHALNNENILLRKWRSSKRKTNAGKAGHEYNNA